MEFSYPSSEILVGDDSIRGFNQIGMRVETGIKKCYADAFARVLGVRIQPHSGRNYGKPVGRVLMIVICRVHADYRPTAQPEAGCEQIKPLPQLFVAV